MSQYQISSVVDAIELVKYVTVTGKLVSISSENYMKLVRLACEFRKAVLYATRMIVKGMNSKEILRQLRGMLNKAYGDSAYKVAKAIVEGCKFNGGNPRHIKSYSSLVRGRHLGLVIETLDLIIPTLLG